MTLGDWWECPACRFPCSGRAMRAVLAAEGACPMCCEHVAPPELVAVSVDDARQRAAQLGAPGTVAAVGPAAQAGAAAPLLVP
jgi:hypothetical protein